MERSILFYLGVILLIGLLFGRLAKRFYLPNVTGYLVAGLLIGPSVLGLIPATVLTGMEAFGEVALGFIAFLVGSDCKLSYLKKLGKTPLIITLCESLGAVALVLAALLIAGYPADCAVMLAAIAAATAPISIIMVARQYRASGPFTDTLLAVVALDDAVALVAFGIASAATTLLHDGIGSSPREVGMAMVGPVIELAGALFIGIGLGMAFSVPLHFFKGRESRLILTCSFILLGVALADLLGLSALLMLLCMGAALANLQQDAAAIPRIADSIAPPVFLLFFVISGAKMQLSLLPSVGLIGILYLVMRALGKTLGSALGAKLTRSPASVQKYLGPALLPQAGVAVGLSLLAAQQLPQHGAAIHTVVLCSTLLCDIVGPAVAKYALRKSGELPAGSDRL